ncbi:MAG: SBBP repeat-containing protein, partial [Thermodesulfobacteriota bacterium]
GTYSSNFPTALAIYGTANSSGDAFVTKVNAAGSALTYSTYLGGTGFDSAYGIAVDSSGSAYVIGTAASSDFPTVSAYQGSFGGGAYDAFVLKIGPALSIDTPSLSFGIKDTAFSAYVMTSGGDGSYTFSTSVGSLPTGLGLNTSTGLISGTPTVAGDTAFTIQVVDGNGDTDTQAYTLTIYEMLVLDYSTYLGGTGWDMGYGIAVDSSENAYVFGYTGSTDFPTVAAIDPTKSSGNDVFVTKINAAGSALVYSTFLGGTMDEFGNSIAVDSTGAVYVTGLTQSSNYPTDTAIYGSYGGNGDAYVTKINAAGSALVYSTYLGGTGGDWGHSIALDSSRAAYVTGYTYSSNFPTASAIYSSYGGSGDAFVTKINAAGSALTYSTYLGGAATDEGNGIVVDSSNNAYVTGQTYSSDFPTASPIDIALSGSSDAFVTKINEAGSALTYSTYLGGSGGEEGHAVDVDSTGAAYVTGGTLSTDFPTASAIYGSLTGFGNYDVFITKLNASGSALTYSTYLGGSSSEQGYGIAVDSSGSAYVTGYTYSNDFPTVSAIYGSYGGSNDAFVTMVNAAGSALAFSTYLGGTGEDWGHGLAIDSSGSAYIIGFTESSDFPTVSAIDGTFNGGTRDAFVAKITGIVVQFTFPTAVNGVLPHCMMGNSYSQTPTSSGGTGPYVYTIASGALPPGINLDGSTGEISGTHAGAGTYTFELLITDADLNTFSTDLSITVGGCDSVSGVDLRVSALTVSQTVQSDGTLVASVSISNHGVVNAGRFFTYVFISKDAVVSGDDKLMGYKVNWAGLSSCTSETSGVLLSMPYTLGAGTFYIIAVVDYLNEVTESDEGNNTKVLPVYPDLLMTVLSGASKVAAGAELQITDTVKNQGHMAAGDTDVNYYLSIDSSVNTSDIYLGSRPIWGIGRGATNTATSSHMVPATTPAGIYYLGAIVDPGDAFAESKEYNNTMATASTVTVSAGMDLIVSAVSGPSSASAGDTISLTSTVENQGSGSSGNVAVNFYISLDSTITTSDIYIGYRPIWGTMAPGATNTATSTQHTIPAGTAGGTYYIGAVVDPGNANAESNEGNNTKAGNTISVSP